MCVHRMIIILIIIVIIIIIIIIINFFFFFDGQKRTVMDTNFLMNINKLDI